MGWNIYLLHYSATFDSGAYHYYSLVLLNAAYVRSYLVITNSSRVPEISRSELNTCVLHTQRRITIRIVTDIMNLCEKACSSSVPRLDTAAALLDVDDANENVLRQKV